MKDICPNCEKMAELELIRTKEEYIIKGESIEIDVEYFKCQECGQEFDNPNSDFDPLEKAYRLYRANHNMVQPENIRE